MVPNLTTFCATALSLFSLTHLDPREFNNVKIQRWQEEIFTYELVLEYIESDSNVWADMLSRWNGLKKTKLPVNLTAADKTFKL